MIAATLGVSRTPADLRQAPETVGSLLTGYRVGILDANGRPVGPHVIGRVFGGGELTFDAYTGGGTKEVIDNMTAFAPASEADVRLICPHW